MKNFIQKTILDVEATLRNDPLPDSDVRYQQVNALLATYWQQCIETDGTLKEWSSLPGVSSNGVLNDCCFNTDNNTGPIEWFITAERANVPGILEVAYWLTGNTDPDEPDDVQTYILETGFMTTPALRIDYYDGSVDPKPLMEVKYRWLPSKLAEL